MEKIRNLSIQKTIILYMLLNFFISFMLSAYIIWAAEETQRQIWWKYTDQEKYFQAIKEEENGYEASIPRISARNMSRLDGQISELCDFLQTFSILIVASLGTVITVALFYTNKIKVPLQELKEASRLISKNKLNFSITYSNRDEMGELCNEFEKMRGQLEENNKRLWKMVEQEKALRAAAAHDIRSPLSILKGYQEMMLEFIPDGSLEKEKIIEMLQAGMSQIDRLNAFADAMREMSKLEDRIIVEREVRLEEFAKQLRQSTEILAKKNQKNAAVILQTDYDTVWFDPEIVLEVSDNLIGNALRYARKQIDIILTAREEELCIAVKDDGAGFGKNAEELTKAYYHSNPQDDMNHFGLGLYISRIYCERHGGKLLLGNKENGGADAIASFRIKKNDEKKPPVL